MVIQWGLIIMCLFVGSAVQAAEPTLSPTVPDRVIELARTTGIISSPQDSCAPFGRNRPTDLQTSILDRRDELQDILRASTTGNALLQNAITRRTGRVWICFSPTLQANGAYYETYGVIFLQGNLERDQAVNYLAHELRHVQQESQGVGQVFRLTRGPLHEQLDTEFANEADASAVAARVAYELRAVGNPLPWRTAIDPQSTSCNRNRVCYDDIARVYGRTRSLVNTFQQWYRGAQRADVYYWSFMQKHMGSGYRGGRSFDRRENGQSIIVAVPTEGLCEANARLGELADGNYLTPAGGLCGVIEDLLNTPQ